MEVIHIEMARRSALVSSASRSPALLDALIEGKGCQPLQQGGRGAVLVAALPEGECVVRLFRRGGLARHVLSDHFLLVNRPLREFQLHAFLYESGAPVAEPLGASWSREGLYFSGAIATRRIMGETLLRRLARGETGLHVLHAVGAAIRNLHDLGVLHADLNGANIIVSREKAFIIDFDKARRFNALSGMRRARNLLRLRRSLEKHGAAPAIFAGILEGYGVARISAPVRALYRLKGAASDRLKLAGPVEPAPRG